MDVAKKISNSLAEKVIVAKLDGATLWDLGRPLERSCTLELLDWEEPEARGVFWHSSAHVLGFAMEKVKADVVIEPFDAANLPTGRILTGDALETLRRIISLTCVGSGPVGAWLSLARNGRVIQHHESDSLSVRVAVFVSRPLAAGATGATRRYRRRSRRRASRYLRRRRGSGPRSGSRPTRS
jgi:hypothetical protein